MLYKDNITDINLNKPNEDPQYDGFLNDTDYPPDEDFFMQLSNDLDLPLIEPDSVLLRDASPNEIISEATSDNFQISNFGESVSDEFNSIDILSENMFPKPELSDIKEEVKTEHFIDFDQYLMFKESPTPSDSSNESLTASDYSSASPLNNFDNSIFDSPPVSPNESQSQSIRANNILQLHTISSSKRIILQTKAQKSVRRLKLDTKECKNKFNKKEFIVKSRNTETQKSTKHLISVNNLFNNSNKNDNVIQITADLPMLQESCAVLKKQDFVHLNKHTAMYSDPITNKSIEIVSSNIMDVKNINVPNGKIPINHTNRGVFKSTNNLLYPKQDGLAVNTVKVLSVPSVTTGVAPIKYASEMDLKAIKKQQRMIKNRESACMSRKRKKDYVSSLEQQLKTLKLENDKLKTENCALKKRITEYEQTKNTAFQLPALITKNTKNTAFLLALLLMVSINIGPFGSLLTVNKTDMDPVSNPIPLHKNTRNLLWVSESSDDVQNDSANNTKNNPDLAMCPMYVNQTESVRLASELRRWIGEPLYNWTNLNTPHEVNRKSKEHFKDMDSVLKDYKLQTKSNSLYRLQKKRKIKNYSIKSDLTGGNEIQVYTFDPKYYEYAEFFESINKRDDTFYIVSFSGDHMLLPALNHNKTSRPKMSLIFPALTLNESTATPNGHIKLMKIDCEVTNTNLVNVKQNSIPNNFRTPFSNVSSSFNVSSENMNNSADNFNDINNIHHNNVSFIRKHRKIYRPYFMKDIADGSVFIDKAKKIVKIP